jgi:hypothetical protein
VLPVALACLAAVTFMGLTIAVAGISTRSVLADVSLILLILPMIAAALVVLAVLIGACIGLWYSLREMPYLFKQAQDFFEMVAGYAKQVTGRITSSLLSLQSTVLAVQKSVADLKSLFVFGRRG